MGMSVTWICMGWVLWAQTGSAGEGQKPSHRRGQRLREGQRGQPTAIFPVTEYAREMAGI